MCDMSLRHKVHSEQKATQRYTENLVISRGKSIGCRQSLLSGLRLLCNSYRRFWQSPARLEIGWWNVAPSV